MRAYLRLAVLAFAICTMWGGRVEAVKVNISVMNDIQDEADPIKLKSVKFSIGEIEEISHEEGQAIGKEFKIKVDLPSIQGMNSLKYKEYLAEQGKELDLLVFGNESKEFGFTIFLGCKLVLNPEVSQNIHYAFLSSTHGFHIYDYQ